MKKKGKRGRRKSLIIAAAPRAAKMSPPVESARARIREQLSTSAATSAERRADRRAATPAKPHRSAARALKSRCFGGLRDLRRAQLQNVRESRRVLRVRSAPGSRGAPTRPRCAPWPPRARLPRAGVSSAAIAMSPEPLVSPISRSKGQSAQSNVRKRAAACCGSRSAPRGSGSAKCPD